MNPFLRVRNVLCEGVPRELDAPSDPGSFPFVEGAARGEDSLLSSATMLGYMLDLIGRGPEGMRVVLLQGRAVDALECVLRDEFPSRIWRHQYH